MNAGINAILESSRPADVEEQRRLVCDYQAAPPGSAARKEAADRLLASVYPFVAKCASRWVRPGVDLDDLTQAGCLGVLKAADRCELSRGLTFLTYAGWWVYKEMQEETTGHRCIVRQRPRTAGARRPPSVFSIDARDSDGLEVCAESGADRGPSPEKRAAVEECADRVREVVRGQLDRRTASMVLGRLGLDGGPQRTLQEVADEHGVSRERVRQIVRQAAKRLPAWLPLDERALWRAMA